MNELVFVQVGMTKAKTLMKYEPEQGGAFDEKAESFVRLYLFENSSLNTFARLVLTPTDNPEESQLIWERVGKSNRYIKYYAVQNEHMPARWGWNDKLINQLYIPKAHPVNDLTSENGDKLYFVANYGGAVEQNLEKILPEQAIHNLDVDEPLPKKQAAPIRKSNKELRIRKILLDATKMAKLAAEAQIEVVKARKPTALVDGFTGNHAGNLQDDCGGAWIAGVDGRSHLGKVWKKLSQNSQSGFYFGDKRHCGIQTTITQYVSVRKAEAESFVAYVNAELGTELYVWTYLD